MSSESLQALISQSKDNKLIATPLKVDTVSQEAERELTDEGMLPRREPLFLSEAD